MKLIKSIGILACVCAAFALAACATTGNRVLGKMTPQQIKTSFHKGMTKKQVTAILGDPSKIVINANSDDVWTYSYKKSKLTASDFIPIYGSLHQTRKNNTKHVVFLFHNNRVVKYSQTSAKGETTSGLW